MKRANYVISVLAVGLGAVFLIIGKDYAKSSTDGGMTTAATWPNILSWIMIGLAILLALTNTFHKNVSPSKINFKSREFVAVLIMILFLLAYNISFCYLGCLITNGIFIPLFLLFLGERKWKLIVVYDITALLIIYLVFQIILQTKLAEPFFI